MKRFFFPSSALILIATSLHCANLAPIQPGCGNNIVEDGEDCDGSVSSVPAEPGKTFACAKPPARSACHFVTTGTAVCPSSLRQGSDGVCRKPGGGFPGVSKTIAPMIDMKPITGRDPIVADFNGDQKLDVAVDHVHSQQTDFAVFQYLDDEVELSTFTIPKRGGVALAVGDFLGRTPEDLKAQNVTNLSSDDPYPLQLDVLIANGPSTNTFVAYQGNSDPGFTPIALSSNDPGTNFRIVPVSAAVFQSFHEDLDVAALLMDCTKPNSMSLCNPPQLPSAGPGLPVSAIWGTEFPQTVLHAAEVASPTSPPAIGNLVMSARAPGGAARCDDLMLAFKGTSALRDAPLCGPTFCDKASKACATPAHTCAGSSCPQNCDNNCRDIGQRPAFDIALSTMPGCTQPTIANAMLLDANHDGIPDVLVSVTCTEGPAVLELDGIADAMMHATGTYQPPRLVGEINGNACKPGVLLAAGDIDQDGVIDYVFNDGIWLSGASGGKLPSPLDDANNLTIGAPCWTQAAVVDVNHDGLPDVVAMTAGTPDVTVLLGNGTSLPTSVSLAADDALQQFVVGDFDGDGTNDIVAVTQAPMGQICSTDNKVLVAWGTPLGIPSDLTTLGRLPAVAQLVAERLFSDPSDTVINNGITDLAILSECTPEQAMNDPIAKSNVQAFVRHGVAVFNGSIDRALVSPYVVRIPNDPAVPIVRALAVGAPYSAGPAPEPEVFALLRTKQGLVMTTLPTTGGGNISAGGMNSLMPVSDVSNSIEPAITTAAIGGQVDVFVAYVAANGKDLTLLDIDGGSVKHQVTLPNAVDFSGMGHLLIVPGDFDGNGGGIAVIAESDFYVNLSKETLAIWYSSSPDKLCQVPSPTADGITGITTVDTGGNVDARSKGIAISTAHDVFLYAPFGNCSLGTGTSLLNPRQGDPAVVGIASGDMNRDGLEDLVVLRFTTNGTPVEIYDQAPSSVGVAKLTASASAATSTSVSTGTGG